MWWVALLAVTQAPDADVTPFIAQRELVVMHVLAPQNATWFVRAPAMLEHARQTVEPLTRLTVVAPSEVAASPAALERCRREATIMCWVLALRPDYDPGGAVFRRPYAEHVQQLKSRGRRYARYALLTTVLDVEGASDRLTLVLIDTDRALASYHAAARDEPGWIDRVEAEVFEKAAHTEANAVDTTNDDAVRALYRRLWEQRRWVLEGQRLWAPNGRLEAETNGGDLYVDGRSAPSNPADVRVGERHVEVRWSSGDVFSKRVQMEEGAHLHVRALRVAEDATTIRAVSRYGGAALAVIGAGLVVTALLAQPNVQAVQPCRGSCAGAGRFITFGELGGSDDPFPPAPSGPLVAPLGYSLVVTGAVWALGPTLEDGAPWWSILGGTLLGVLSYGISAAVN